MKIDISSAYADTEHEIDRPGRRKLLSLSFSLNWVRKGSIAIVYKRPDVAIGQRIDSVCESRGYLAFVFGGCMKTIHGGTFRTVKIALRTMTPSEHREQ